MKSLLSYNYIKLNKRSNNASLINDFCSQPSWLVDETGRINKHKLEHK